MRNLLVLEVSPRGAFSTSRKLAQLFVERWKEANPDGRVQVRDLMQTDLPFVDLAWITGAFTPSDTHAPETAAAIKVSNYLVAELQAADHVLIATPMYNFSIPAVLKAYIDQIVRVGITVSSDNVGLLTGKRADIILASGGDFSPGSHIEQFNQASGYLTQVLAWIGIKNVNIVLADAARAGQYGETAADAFQHVVSAAVTRADSGSAY